MKRFFFSILLALFCIQGSMAQTANEVFREFRDVKRVEATTVPKSLMRLGAKNVRDGSTKKLLSQLERLQVLDLDDCSKRNRKKFVNRINDLEKYGYEEYGRISGSGDNVLVLTRKADKKVSELVILLTDKDDCKGILVEGNINPDDIQAITGEVIDD